MAEQDICLKMESGRFNYRVGAIVIDGGEILMVKNSGMPFYYTVGGRVKFGATAEESVLREAFEETGVWLEIDRLIFIHENFFTFDASEEFFHEISLFFLMKPNPQLKESRSKHMEDYGEVEHRWLPIDKLSDEPIYPDFFKTELRHISSELKHFVTRNGVTLQSK